MNRSINIEANKIRNNTMYRGCVHKDDECDGKTSKAHSIQENRVLKNLSSNSEVMCINFSKIGLNRHLRLDRVGIGQASTFTGFCNHHDHIFIPIEEQDFDPNNKEQLYLFAYRAFALGYYERQSTYGFKKEHLDIMQEKGYDTKDFEKEVSYYKVHLEFLESLRIGMNKNLDNRRFDRICTNVIVWPQNYGLAATSMFFIYKDKEERVVNSSSERLFPFFFSVIPQNDKTFVLMSCLTKDKARYEFIKEQIVQAEIAEQKMLVSNLLAMYVENFFISPDRWKDIPVDTQNMFMETMESFLGKEKPKIGFFRDLNLFI